MSKSAGRLVLNAFVDTRLFGLPRIPPPLSGHCETPEIVLSPSVLNLHRSLTYSPVFFGRHLAIKGLPGSTVIAGFLMGEAIALDQVSAISGSLAGFDHTIRNRNMRI